MIAMFAIRRIIRGYEIERERESGREREGERGRERVGEREREREREREGGGGEK